MQKISINKTNAIAAFKNADDKGKKLLTDLLGKENVSGNIMDMVKCYEDACAIEGIDPLKNLPYPNPVNADQEYLNAVAESNLVIRVLNEGWKPNYKNDKQPKWRAWLKYDTSVSAFRFHGAYYDYTNADTGTGSRHVFEKQEVCEYFHTQFIDLVNRTINN